MTGILSDTAESMFELGHLALLDAIQHSDIHDQTRCKEVPIGGHTAKLLGSYLFSSRPTPAVLDRDSFDRLHEI